MVIQVSTRVCSVFRIKPIKSVVLNAAFLDQQPFINFKYYNNDPDLRNLLSSDRIINKTMLAALWKKKKWRDDVLENIVQIAADTTRPCFSCHDST